MKYILLAFALTFSVSAQNTDDRLKKMEEMMHKMQKELKAKDDKIGKLEKKVEKIDTTHKEAIEFYKSTELKNMRNRMMTLDGRISETLNELNMTAIFNMVAGASSVRDSDLERFQGGAHDPNKRGFGLQQLELIPLKRKQPTIQTYRP